MSGTIDKDDRLSLIHPSERMEVNDILEHIKQGGNVPALLDAVERGESPYRISEAIPEEDLTTITVQARDPEGTLESLLKAIAKAGNGGHSFSIVVDPELTEKEGGSQKFYWDGDGSDHIQDVETKKRVGEE